MPTTEEAVQGLWRVAARTPFTIAPEKAKALLEEVFKTGAWSLSPTDGKAMFFALVDKQAVYASHAGLASLWCLAFTSYCVMDLASRAARDPEFKEDQMDLGECWAKLQLDDYLGYARRLMRGDEAWPEHLAVPDTNKGEADIEWRINNLFYGALGWILLHEIAHIHHRDETLLPADQRKKQEYEADGFATNWILNEAGAGLLQEFRVLAVTTALAWLLLHQQTVGTSPTHPPSILRFKEVISKYTVGARSVGLENSSYMLKALFDPAADMPTRMNALEAFEWVCGRLAVQFGQ